MNRQVSKDIVSVFTKCAKINVLAKMQQETNEGVSEQMERFKFRLIYTVLSF